MLERKVDWIKYFKKKSEEFRNWKASCWSTLSDVSEYSKKAYTVSCPVIGIKTDATIMKANCLNNVDRCLSDLFSKP
jgi:hypothetical protein